MPSSEEDKIRSAARLLDYYNSQEDPVSSMHDIHREIMQETDRGAVLFGAAWLDDLLAQLIEKSFCDFPKVRLIPRIVSFTRGARAGFW